MRTGLFFPATMSRPMRTFSGETPLLPWPHFLRGTYQRLASIFPMLQSSLNASLDRSGRGGSSFGSSAVAAAIENAARPEKMNRFREFGMFNPAKPLLVFTPISLDRSCIISSALYHRRPSGQRGLSGFLVKPVERHHDPRTLFKPLVERQPEVEHRAFSFIENPKINCQAYNEF